MDASLFPQAYDAVLSHTRFEERLAFAALVWLLWINIRSYRVFRADKLAAAQNQWRVPELRLIFLAATGGWLGARLAQRVHRHKTSKRAFQASMVGAGCASALCYLFFGVLVFGQSSAAQGFDLTPIKPALGYIDATASYIYIHATHFGAAVWGEFGPTS